MKKAHTDEYLFNHANRKIDEAKKAIAEALEALGTTTVYYDASNIYHAATVAKYNHLITAAHTVASPDSANAKNKKRKREKRKMKNYVHTSEHFYGNKISDYGLKNGFVDYRTLARSFDAVLNNDLISKTYNIGYWEIVNGDLFWEDEDGNEIENEIFQFFIISDNGARILQELTNEIVYYNEELDIYIWGVTHYGTGWDYVLTDIKIDLNEG